MKRAHYIWCDRYIRRKSSLTMSCKYLTSDLTPNKSIVDISVSFLENHPNAKTRHKIVLLPSKASLFYLLKIYNIKRPG